MTILSFATGGYRYLYFGFFQALCAPAHPTEPLPLVINRPQLIVEIAERSFFQIGGNAVIRFSDGAGDGGEGVAVAAE